MYFGGAGFGGLHVTSECSDLEPLSCGRCCNCGYGCCFNCSAPARWLCIWLLLLLRLWLLLQLLLLWLLLALQLLQPLDLRLRLRLLLLRLLVLLLLLLAAGLEDCVLHLSQVPMMSQKINR